MRKEGRLYFLKLGFDRYKLTLLAAKEEIVKMKSKLMKLLVMQDTFADGEKHVNHQEEKTQMHLD